MTEARLHYPYGFDAQGRTRRDSVGEWVRGLIEQVLMTAPGERVMRSNFGSGIRQLVFGPASPEVAATVQALTQGALQQYLGTIIVLHEVTTTAQDASLVVTVTYAIRATGEVRTDTVDLGGPP